MLAILVDGDPQESFSPLLLHTFDEEGNITGDTEPLAANIAGDDHSINKRAFRREIVRICAALLGCPFDALWQRQRRARTNRLVALMAAATAVMGVFMGIVLNKNRQITAQNEQITAQNEQITAQNGQITAQNGQITAQNLELRRQRSSILVDAGGAQLENHDVFGALRSALSALPEEEGQPYDPRAEALLAEALCAYQTGAIQSRLLYTQPLDIVDLAVTADGAAALLADPVCCVRCVSVRDGSLLWEALSSDAPGSGEAALDLILSEPAGVVICKNTTSVRALDLLTGETVWDFVYTIHNGNNFRCLSPDGTVLMLMDPQDYSSRINELVALDAATGVVIGRFSLSVEEQPTLLIGTRFWYDCGAAFSDDGGLFAFAQELPEENGRYLCVLVDTANWEILRKTTYPGAPSSVLPLFLGLHVNNGTGEVFCAQYESGYGGVLSTLITWDGGEAAQALTNKTMGSSSGISLDILSEMPVVPMITSDRLAVVFVQESMFLYDMAAGKLLRGYAFNSSVLSGIWKDRNEEQVLLFTSDGVAAVYDLESRGGNVLRAMNTRRLDQTGLASAVNVNYPDAFGSVLTVPAGQGGQLLLTGEVSDPDGAEVDGTADGYTSYFRVRISPSGTRRFIFYPGRDTTTVVVSDTVTGRELRRAEISMSYRAEPMILDDESFVAGFCIYKLVGSVERLEKLDGDSGGMLYETDYSTVMLHDGRTLTVYTNPYRLTRTLIPCWLNGRLVSASQDVETGIAFDRRDALSIGANGFVVGYGRCSLAESADGGRALSEGENAFYAFDALSGRHLLITDPFADSAQRNIVPGCKTPVMACWDERGSIYLISLSDGSVRSGLPSYQPGEVLKLCFSPDDAWLAVLTRSGRLDIYDTAAEQTVFSQVPRVLRRIDISYVTEMSCQFDSRGRLLFSVNSIGDSYGCFLVIDADSWTLSAQAEKVYAYLPADDGVYALRDNRIFRYPLHTLDGLAALACGELERGG